MTTTIAYLGSQGSFSHLTAQKHFGGRGTFVSVPSFVALFDAVQGRRVDNGVVPLENSLAGSVYENYDLLHRHDVAIVGEAYANISLCLLAARPIEGNLTGLKRVYSHPKALEQCCGFFAQHPWVEAIASGDTASAAAKVAQEGDPFSAAIASASAATLYGLEIVRHRVEDAQDNYTRFVFIAHTGDRRSVGDRCSLLFTLPHRSGALAGVFTALAARGLNVTKIESRPLVGSPFEYVFYLDVDIAGLSAEKVDAALEELTERMREVKVLGIYNTAKVKI